MNWLAVIAIALASASLGWSGSRFLTLRMMRNVDRKAPRFSPDCPVCPTYARYYADKGGIDPCERCRRMMEDSP